LPLFFFGPFDPSAFSKPYVTMLTSMLTRSHQHRQADNSRHWKPHFSTKIQLPDDVISWLCFEHIKTLDEATDTDDTGSFVTNNAQLKKHGTWFNPIRLESGQIKRFYLIETNFEGTQIYVAKDANKVGFSAVDTPFVRLGFCPFCDVWMMAGHFAFAVGSLWLGCAHAFRDSAFCFWLASVDL